MKKTKNSCSININVVGEWPYKILPIFCMKRCKKHLQWYSHFVWGKWASPMQVMTYNDLGFVITFIIVSELIYCPHHWALRKTTILNLSCWLEINSLSHNITQIWVSDSISRNIKKNPTKLKFFGVFFLFCFVKQQGRQNPPWLDI